MLWRGRRGQFCNNSTSISSERSMKTFVLPVVGTIALLAFRGLAYGGENTSYHTFNSATNPSFAVSASGATLTLLGRENSPARCSACTYNLILKTASATRAIALTSLIEDPVGLSLTSSNAAAIIGWVNGTGSAVTVFDPNSGKVVAEFLCYNPSLSPSGRYVAFVQFYQQHGQPSLKSLELTRFRGELRIGHQAA